MDTQPDGPAIAQQRIEAEARGQTGFLDLSQLGLTELPEALFKLTHLRRLHLGLRVAKRDDVWKPSHWVRPDGPSNRLDDLCRLAPLHDLEALSISELDCPSLDFVAKLPALQWLDCSGTYVTDLSPVSKLPALQWLDCTSTGVSDLAPLAMLSGLQFLSCFDTEVTDLGPLATLPVLRSLSCGARDLSDLAPLATLTALRALGCAGTQVSDLKPLEKLTELRTLDCHDTQVSDLLALASLTALEALDCSWTKISDLGPLEKLIALETIKCSITDVADLKPLRRLSALRTLECQGTRIADLGPLASLIDLQTLDCQGTQVFDLAPLKSLKALRTLDCARTKVSDLTPLESLPALERLELSRCPLTLVPDDFWLKPSLRVVRVFDSWGPGSAPEVSVPGVPPEIFSRSDTDGQLAALRAHSRDLAAGKEHVTDVKLLVLGNARAGKTQLTRFLCNQPFEQAWNSTHAIRVVDTALPGGDGQAEAQLHIWDFGGQDIYHGTHALFVRTRAVFMVVWAKDTEPPPFSEDHDGLTFRKNPLHYWGNYVGHLNADHSPVVVVQTKCDTDADETPVFPLPTETRALLGAMREVRFSAPIQHRGHEELRATLHGAIGRLWEQQGVAEIGKGRLRLQRRLEALRCSDGSLPDAWKLIDQATFRTWCDEAGDISSAGEMLRYLNNAGVVIYQQGLFGDQIVLDHAWALNAIYAVFDRTRSYKGLLRDHGRFNRTRLERLAWDEFSPDEQRLFLTMMQSSGICFVYRRGPSGQDDETIYIAPDLLPERSAVQTQIIDWWGAEPGQKSVTFDYPMLHPGLMRAAIARIGNQAGIDAIYWRGGVIVYETQLASYALIEHAIPDGACAGTVTLQTKGGLAKELLDRLAGWLGEESERLGLRPTATPTDFVMRPVVAGAPRFGPEPAENFDGFVSYAWGADTQERKRRQASVMAFCAEANRLGRRVLCDQQALGLGDRIGAFMRRLGAGKRVFVFLSDEYLRSPNCMLELREIWRNSRQDDVEFLSRIRVFNVDGVRVHPQKAREVYQDWWDKKVEEDKATVGKHLSKAKLHRIKNDLDGFINVSEIADDCLNMLALIADTLTAQSWDQFVAAAFNDLWFCQ
jgi:internalin A